MNYPCRVCKKNEDARTRLGGACHECTSNDAYRYPVLRAVDVRPGMRVVDGRWHYSAAWL